MKSAINVTLVLIAVMASAVFVGEKYTDSKIPELLQETPISLLYEEEVTILGQGEAVIGELVRLEVQGELVEWDCLPQTDDLQEYGENNQNCVVSFRKGGTYNVISAVYAADKVTILHHPITVEGIKTPTTPDRPIPTPDPIPDYDDVTLDEDLIKLVQQWCRRTLANKQHVSDLSLVFQMVSLEMKKGELNTTSEIFARTAELNSEIDLSGMGRLMSNIQKYITTKSDSGELEDIPSHLTVWISIAEGLERYAGK